MGNKLRIIKVEDGCEESFDKKEVHGLGDINGDQGTVCGIPFVDYDAEIKETNRAITCKSCIIVIEARTNFKKRNGKWY